jgi:hypothetical protein
MILYEVFLIFVAMHLRSAMSDILGGSNGSSASQTIDKDLAACLHDGNCGMYTICSFSFEYQEVCAISGHSSGTKGTSGSRATAGLPNCTEDENTSKRDAQESHSSSISTKSRQIGGGIFLLRNGLSKSVEYTWNAMGYEPRNDDATERKYVLPPRSFVYVDTGIGMPHTVRLQSGGQVIAVRESSNRKCTVETACGYMLKACESSFVYLATSSVGPKIKCAEYSKACNYFIYPPDLSADRPVGDGETSNDGDGNSDESYLPYVEEIGTDGDNGDDSSQSAISKDDQNIDDVRARSSQCMVDCLWNYYPSKYVHYPKSHLETQIDSLDAMRRVHLGLTLNPKTCADKEFIDDRRNIYVTTEQQELANVLSHGGSVSGSNAAIIALLVVLLVLVALALLGFLIYYKWYVPKYHGANSELIITDNYGSF